MHISTIGFTKKSAERFFGLLGGAGVTTLVDVRLNNVSQLAGFAKRDDLEYFLRQILGVRYVHRPDLAPTQDLLDDAVLLCSEDQASRCHRRLVADYLAGHWDDVTIEHLA